ncbi:MAG TPA: cellulase family glycosylhydrolase [Verrucomicrobiota bacterium]|nr:cellulase family glycosylhydrolase [Verrucomicrobiota bacterium]HNU50556.1 cellulase family glycosylhydrolase [Verrucomicrobiota bacterium]
MENSSAIPRCRHRRSALAALVVLSLAIRALAAGFEHRITARGDQLFEGDRPFRFLSFNIPNLHLVEDNVGFATLNPWRWPDRFEITDALESTRQAGGTVVRTYVLSVVRTHEGPEVPRHVLGPGRFNEEGFRALDLVLQVANETGVRLILPFVDNWSWWGGAAEYAGFRGKSKAAFWTDPSVIEDFKATIRFVVHRTNTLTGVRYREDKAILAWETGNELESPPEWTGEIARYIKSLDPNHLVIDGFHSTTLREASLAIPEVDVVTTHHYPGGPKSYAALIRDNWAKAKGRKPYFVGEFGFVDTPAVRETLDAVRETGTAGALIWSLRFRNRDGGFYWHSEPAGGDKYKAYHWPGFASGAGYDESGLLALVQREAFALRGMPIPPLALPSPPRLLPSSTPGALAWQGRVGATAYAVERATAREGPWTVAAADVDETAAPYRPLFADLEARPGVFYYYRVRARNGAGLSAPSAVLGPLIAAQRVLVDELVDDRWLHARSGETSFRTRDTRKAREDYHRLGGAAGSTMVYRVGGPLREYMIDVFFPDAVADPRLAVSADGVTYRSCECRPEPFLGGEGDYGYWKAVRYRGRVEGDPARFLRVEFTGAMEVGRVELGHAEPGP